MSENANDRLKRAVNSVEVPPFLEARVRNRIRAEGTPLRSPLRNWGWAAGFAAVVFAVMAVFLWQTPPLRESEESTIASVTGGMSTFLRVAMGDHLHCAIFRKWHRQPRTVQAALATLGPAYEGLTPALQPRVPAAYKVYAAHRCSRNGRSFVHLTLESDGKPVSLLITRKQAGEESLPNSVAGLRADRFTMDAFETRGHFVYIVSELPAGAHEQLLAALREPVREYLKSIEL